MRGNIKYAAVAIVAFFLILILVRSMILSSKYGGRDLRTRVVGARNMAEGRNPYFSKWNPVHGDKFLDPNDPPDRLVNGNVVTPAVMVLTRPLNSANYRTIRLVWTISLILAGLLSAYMLSRRRERDISLLVGLLCVVGFVCSEIWIYNLERGQMYIFYLFLLSLSYACYRIKWKYSAPLSGFIAALLVFLRPFALVFAVGFLISGKFRWLAGYLAGLVLFALVFALPFRKDWTSYFQAMSEYSSEMTGHPRTISNAAKYEIPTTIEGATNLTREKAFDLERLQTLYDYIGRLGVRISLPVSLLIYAFVVGIATLMFWNANRGSRDSKGFFILGALMMIMGEYFTITPRGSYNIIQWMFPLALVVAGWSRNVGLMLSLCTSLIILHNLPFFIPHQGEIAELGFIFVCAFALVSPPRDKDDVESRWR